jgi:2-polyprenyl-3-methyl-5-hydroxy-6-metoxy-1,4-benzoquinol methylase
MQSAFNREVASSARFEFGRNWARFLRCLNEERIATARGSLREMLGLESLAGRSFLDVGSGSGLFSLAARQLGARVRSFDYDPHSVACTRELRQRYFPGDADWTVEDGSVLDGDYVRSLGRYDIVYSWGVLHHTGAMWQALENVSGLVADNGLLFIAIYNDQGSKSHYWRFIKRQYNTSRLGRAAIIATHVPYFYLQAGVGRIRKGRRRRERGMSRWHDLLDWLGGYPFEVAKPEEIFRFYRDRGFQLRELITCRGGLGCNQYVFAKQPGAGS